MQCIKVISPNICTYIAKYNVIMDNFTILDYWYIYNNIVIKHTVL